MQSFSLGITSSSYKQSSTTIDLVLNKVEQTTVALEVCFRYGRFSLESRFMLAHAASQLELGAIQLLWCQYGIGLYPYILALQVEDQTLFETLSAT
jgi:hypothetical protein